MEGPKESGFRDLVASINIDPRLLGEDDSTNSGTEQGDLDTLGSTVLLTQGAQEDGMEDAALESLFLGPRITFVTRYSGTNVTTHNLVASARAKSQAGKIKRIEGMVPGDSSRDKPTPFEYCRSKIQGCPFHSIHLGNLLDHEKPCTFLRVKKSERKLVPCMLADCQSKFADEMLNHV